MLVMFATGLVGAAPSPTTSPTCVDYKATRAVMAARGLSQADQKWVLSIVALLRPQDRSSARWDKIRDENFGQTPGPAYIVVYVLDGAYGPTVVATQEYQSGLVDKIYWTHDLTHESFDDCQQIVIPAAPT